MRHLQKIGFFLFCAPFITFSAYAVDIYPVRPVKIIAPQAPGGGVDIVGAIGGSDNPIPLHGIVLSLILGLPTKLWIMSQVGRLRIDIAR